MQGAGSAPRRPAGHVHFFAPRCDCSRDGLIEAVRVTEETSKSLLLRAAQGEPEAWHRFTALYQPLIRGWLMGYDVHPQEVQNLTQEVLAILVEDLGHYRPGG